MSTNRCSVTIVATNQEALSQLAVEPITLNARSATTLGSDRRVVVTACDIASPAAFDFMAVLTIEKKCHVRVVFLEIARDSGKRDHPRPTDEAVATAIRFGCPIGRAVLVVDASAELDISSLRALGEECAGDDRLVAGWLTQASGTTAVIVRSLARPGPLPGNRRLLLVEHVEPSVGARLRALPGAHVGPPGRWTGPYPPRPIPLDWTVAVLSRGDAVRATLPALGDERLRDIIQGYGRTTDFVPLVHISSSLDDLLWRAHCRSAPDAPVLWVPGQLEGARRVWGIGYGGEHAPLATLARQRRSTIPVGLAFVPASVIDGLERAAGLLDGTQLVRLEGTTFRSDYPLDHPYELHDPPAFISPAGLLERDRRNERRKLLPYDHGSGSRHAKGELQLALRAERTGNQIERLVDAGHAEQLGWPPLDGVAALDPVDLPRRQRAVR